MSRERIMIARSFLFVPGDRPDDLTRPVPAVRTRSSSNLEDAVSIERKADARESLRTWLAPKHSVLIRFNAV
jgi:citrate lyase subunit beta/citryl-CoA lyase